MNRRPRRRRDEGRPIEGLPNAITLRIRKPYLKFFWALESLNYHFDNWLLPREPEEVAMTRVILALQNILEYESELAIALIASRSSNPRDRKLQSRIEECCSPRTTGHGHELPRAAMNSRGERYPSALCG